MADVLSYVDQFLPNQKQLEGIRREQKTAVQDYIGSQEDLSSQIQAAFEALGESQKPTTFDKIADAALGVAAAVDISKGGRKGSLASEKYRTFRAGRKEEQARKREELANRFLQRLRLADFAGQSGSRNLNAILSLSGQEAGDVYAGAESARGAATTTENIASSKQGRKESEARIKAASKEPTAEERRNQGLLDLHEQATSAVKNQLGTYDPDKWDSFKEYQDAYDGLYFKEISRLQKLMAVTPTDKGKKQPSKSDKEKILQFFLEQPAGNAAAPASPTIQTPQRRAVGQAFNAFGDLANFLGRLRSGR